MRCIAQVWKRDTYRHTGRGKSGFSMHYNRCQCSRSAKPGTEWCGQHAKLQGFGPLMIYPWAERLPIQPDPVSSPCMERS